MPFDATPLVCCNLVAHPVGCLASVEHAVEPKHAPIPAVFAWTGLVSAFRKANFVEVFRRASSQVRTVLLQSFFCMRPFPHCEREG